MSPIHMSRLESAVRIVLKFNEAFNRRDVPGMIKLVTEDCSIDPAAPELAGNLYAGRDAVETYWQELLLKSPDAHIEIEDIFGSGTRCVTLWRQKWTGSDGDDGYVRGVDIYRVTDGLICEILSYVKQ